jgi:hypothetical protein
LVEVWDVGEFAVLRNDEPLYHANCRATRFLTSAAAQAAAELHLALGWSGYERPPDCLPFNWGPPVHSDTPLIRERTPRITRDLSAATVDDEHTWSWEELESLCQPWGYPFWLARSERSKIARQVPHPMVQSSLDPDCVHDGADVVHPLVHGRQVSDAIGKPSASLIEEHETRQKLPSLFSHRAKRGSSQ